MKVAVFFFPPWLRAGSTAFTAHLVRALRFAGHEPTVYRVLDAAKGYAQPFGDYAGITYSVTDAPGAKQLVRDNLSIMAAVAPPPFVRDGVVSDLMALGMRPVIHTEVEAAGYDWSQAHKPIVIRQAMLDVVPGSVYIPQPYLRNRPKEPDVRLGSVSLARVAASKRTDMVLRADRLVAKELQVRQMGYEEPLYAKQLQADYPDVFQASSNPTKVPLDFVSAPAACASSAFHVDMSRFERDGGGTQYAELEAMDAGCVCVMHEDWFRFEGDVKANVHALPVADDAALAAAMGGQWADHADIRANCEALLAAHNPVMLGHVWANALISGLSP